MIKLLRAAPRLESRELRAVRPVVVVLVEPARLPTRLLPREDAGRRELERDRQSVRMFASEVVLFNSWKVLVVRESFAPIDRLLVLARDAERVDERGQAESSGERSTPETEPSMP